MTHDSVNDITGADRPTGPNRRTLVAGAAWTIPAIAIATAVPAAAASNPDREFAIESVFGVGWYPTTQGQTTSGALQYDAKTTSTQYLRITGTEAGDVVTGVYIDVLISTNWPAPTFTALPGSNPAWTTLATTGTTTTVNGVTYNVYRSLYTAPIVATATATTIPVDFFFRSSSQFYAGSTAQTRRFATVNGTPVTLVRNPANINNTNVVLADAPTP